MLRLTKRSEYGLMALAYMAGAGGRYCSVRTIVAELGVPRRLLAEVLKDLSRAGLLEAARGPGGGYRLVRAPEDVTLATVVETLEGPVRVVECEQDGACSFSPACCIQDGIHTVAERIHGVLEEFTLAQLCAPAEDRAPQGAVTV